MRQTGHNDDDDDDDDDDDGDDDENEDDAAEIDGRGGGHGVVVVVVVAGGGGLAKRLASLVYQAKSRLCGVQDLEFEYDEAGTKLLLVEGCDSRSVHHLLWVAMPIHETCKVCAQANH